MVTRYPVLETEVHEQDSACSLPSAQSRAPAQGAARQAGSSPLSYASLGNQSQRLVSLVILTLVQPIVTVTNVLSFPILFPFMFLSGLLFSLKYILVKQMDLG